MFLDAAADCGKIAQRYVPQFTEACTPINATEIGRDETDRDPRRWGGVVRGRMMHRVTNMLALGVCV
jgi:predicted NAD-dependent protein-ADP-ribosyltransferase YbiA (DUF1768 family)